MTSYKDIVEDNGKTIRENNLENAALKNNLGVGNSIIITGNSVVTGGYIGDKEIAYVEGSYIFKNKKISFVNGRFLVEEQEIE